jgi:hypothetical protein
VLHVHVRQKTLHSDVYLVKWSLLSDGGQIDWLDGLSGATHTNYRHGTVSTQVQQHTQLLPAATLALKHGSALIPWLLLG